jgi:hypothetical protein
VHPAMPRRSGAIRLRREGPFALAPGGAPGGATIVGIDPGSPGVAIAGTAGLPLVLVRRGRTPCAERSHDHEGSPAVADCHDCRASSRFHGGRAPLPNKAGHAGCRDCGAPRGLDRARAPLPNKAEPADCRGRRRLYRYRSRAMRRMSPCRPEGASPGGGCPLPSKSATLRRCPADARHDGARRTPWQRSCAGRSGT